MRHIYRTVRRGGRAALVGATTLAMVAAGSGAAAAATAQTSTPALVGDPAGLVNPFIGTGSGGPVVGQIDLFPGAAVPFGMLTFSPNTPSQPDGGGYNYSDSSILGFSLTHISGPGCSAYGDIPILPTVGAIGSDPVATTGPFSHAHEKATPGYYSVTLSPGTPSAIGAELSATTRTGIARFDFPATKQANVLFKVGDSQMGNSAADVHIVGNDELTGSATSGHFCGSPGTYTVHFVATFDRPFSSYGTWNGTTVSPSSRAAANHGPARAPRPAGPTGAPLSPAASANAKAAAPAQTGTPSLAAPGVEAKGSQSRTQVPGTSGPSSGAWVTFDTASPASRVVKMKVAISYVSTSNAMLNLASGDPGWSLSAVANAAHTEWNRLLSRIQIGGGTHDEQVQFYTALYHALLDPNVFSDVNGEYIGFDNKVHHLAPGQAAQYANFSGWDIYRSEVPLLATMAPHRTSDMITSLLNDEAQGGWLPKWPLANDYTGVMNGDAADPIIADAYAFGARNFDAPAALAAMIKGATQVPTSPSQLGQGSYEERPGLQQYESLGYVPGDASETLEYTTADFGISRLAAALGDAATAREFLRRSQNWQNIFDTTASYRGYSGYIEPRNANGSFPSGPAFQVAPGAFGQSGFQEGNATQYTWAVPQDLAGLFSAMGGNAVVVKRLDTLFTQLNVGPNEPYYWAGNEPGLGIPWEYDYAGAPSMTQSTVHRLITSVYADSPGGEPGNDDLGAMSSWLVWAYLGLYPETPGAQVLALGAPVFPIVELHLANGHRVTISAPGASTSTFVRGLTVNGVPSSKDWIASSLLTGPATTTPGHHGAAMPPGNPPGPVAGGGGLTTLSFTMGATPSSTWGTTPASEPPSYPSGPISLPPNANLAASPAVGGVSPGGTSTETLTLDNSSGTSPLTVHWTATSSGALAVSPSSGSLSAAAGADATATLTLTAPADASQGFDNLTLSGTAADGSALPPVVVPVAIAPPSSILRSYNNVGIADFANQSCGNFDGLQGAYSESQLEAAGLSPGATVTAAGARITWPDVPVCEPDNIQAAGQTVPVAGTPGARALVVLGAGGDGNASGTVTLHYTDGTTSTATLGFGDWALSGGGEGPQFGNTIVATTPYRYESGSYQKLALYVFAAQVPLDPAKTLASITLPAASAVSGAPSTTLHVFAMAEADLFTTPSTVPLAPGGSAAFNLGVVNPTGATETVTWKPGPLAAGLSLSPPSGTLTVPAGSVVETRVQVAASASATQGVDSFSLSGSSGSASIGSVTETVDVAAPGNLTPFFNNVGITDASDPAAGNFDGDGNSYIAQSLAADGLTPGAHFTADGASLSWPDVAAGQPDNIATNGQILLAPTMPSGAKSLVIVGSATNGPSHGSLTLTYASGLTEQVQLGFTDWTLNGGSASGPSFANSVVAKMASRNCAGCGGVQSVATYLFAESVPLQAGQALQTVTLPTSTDNGGQLHVFALAGSTTASPQTPVVTSLSPSPASAGQEVTISGSGFGATQGAGFVHFADNGVNWGEPGNVAAFTVDSWSDTAITFTVPVPSDGYAVVPGTVATVTVHDATGTVSDPVQLPIAS